MKKLLTLLLTVILCVSCNPKKKTDAEASENGSIKQEQPSPHVLIVNYNLKDMSIEQHNELGATVAPNFTPEKIEGLIGKSFIGNTETGIFGGVYHFKTKEAINNYLSSEFWQGIENHPNLVNFTKEIYGVAPISTISNGIPTL